MPSGKEILLDLARRVGQLEDEVAELKKHRGDDWLEEELDLDVTPAVAPEDKPDPMQQDEASGDIQILAPNRAQREFRKRWLDRIALENLPKEWGLKKEEADEAYLEGGPVWLYLTAAGFNEEEKSGRHYILSLPEDVRASMVNDLMLGDVSPKWIHEFGRDILKDASDEGAKRAATIISDQIAEGYVPAGSMAQS